MDCMEALKQMPDKSVELAIVDPPYGAGFTEGGGCQGWFSKYHQSEEKSSQFCKVERERRASRGTGSEDGSTGTRRRTHITHSESGSAARVTRTGGTWAEKYAKKSFRGTLPRKKSIFKNFFVSHGIK